MDEQHIQSEIEQPLCGPLLYIQSIWRFIHRSCELATPASGSSRKSTRCGRMRDRSNVRTMKLNRCHRILPARRDSHTRKSPRLYEHVLSSNNGTRYSDLQLRDDGMPCQCRSFISTAQEASTHSLTVYSTTSRYELHDIVMERPVLGLIDNVIVPCSSLPAESATTYEIRGLRVYVEMRATAK